MEGNLRAAFRDLGAARRCDPVRFARLGSELGNVVAQARGEGRDNDAPTSLWHGQGSPTFQLEAPHLEAPGQDPNGLQPGSGWFWYLDPADQGSATAGAGLPQGWGWHSGRAEPRDPVGADKHSEEREDDGAGPGWWSDSVCDDLDDLSPDLPPDLAEFETPIGDEGAPGVESPLASFYQELGAEEADYRADDFSSDAEEIRFRDLPPIRRSDVDSIDWEDLAARLRDLG